MLTIVVTQHTELQGLPIKEAVHAQLAGGLTRMRSLPVAEEVPVLQLAVYEVKTESQDEI